MIIGVNGWYYSQPHTGIGQYTAGLVSALAENLDGSQINVFVDSIPERSGATREHHTHADFIRIPGFNRKNELLNKVNFESKVLVNAKELHCDILHTPYLYAPSHRTPGLIHVATIHDMIHRIYTQYRGGIIRTWITSRYERKIKNLDLVVTDSQYSRRDIEHFLCLYETRIRVIYPSVDRSFSLGVLPASLSSVAKKYELPKEFILYIGGFDFRKNVPILLEAFSNLVRDNRIVKRLVIAGKFSPTAKQLKLHLVDDLTNLAVNLGIDKEVQFIGYVPQSELPALYQLANLLVYPSLYEGFGLPILEAMYCGTPVLASNTTSIPELVNRDDLLFDPRDPDMIAEKIRWVLASKRLRDEISQWGLERACRYSWSDYVREIADAYNSVMR